MRVGRRAAATRSRGSSAHASASSGMSSTSKHPTRTALAHSSTRGVPHLGERKPYCPAANRLVQVPSLAGRRVPAGEHDQAPGPERYLPRPSHGQPCWQRARRPGRNSGPSQRASDLRFCWSGRRDSNPRPSPWQVIRWTHEALSRAHSATRRSSEAPAEPCLLSCVGRMLASRRRYSDRRTRAAVGRVPDVASAAAARARRRPRSADIALLELAPRCVLERMICPSCRCAERPRARRPGRRRARLARRGAGSSPSGPVRARTQAVCTSGVALPWDQISSGRR